MKIMILSGSDRIRFLTMINQKAYADRHGYRYRFDVGPHRNRNNLYFHKLNAIYDALQDTDWLFWIDDDAAFTQMACRFEARVPELGDASLCAVFCASPVNLQGGWTTISSGNFFVRNTPLGRELVRLAMQTDLAAVAGWWNQEALGMFTSGDQDALVFQIKTNPLFADTVKILEFERFNTRPYHFERADQYFLVHFTHSPTATKAEQIEQFGQEYGLGRFLLRDEDLMPYASYVEPQLKMAGGL
jgi:hypothetical protein